MSEPSTEAVNVAGGEQETGDGVQIEAEAGEGHAAPTPATPAPKDGVELNQTQGTLGGQEDFKVINVDGQEVFECSTCGKKFDVKKTMKSHVTRMHKKAKDKDPTNPDEPEANKSKKAPFDMNRLNKYQSTSRTSTQNVEERIGDATMESLFASQGDPNPGEEIPEEPEAETMESLKQELEESKVKVKSMMEEFAVMTANSKEKDAKVESLKEALETNKQLLDVSQAKTNSLQMLLEEETNKVQHFEDTFIAMETTIKELESATKKNVDPNTEKLIKNLKDEVKSKKKEVEEANKRTNTAIKNMKEETNTRSVAQANLIKANKFSESQTKIIEKLEKLLEMKTGEKRRRSRSDDRREVRRRTSRSRSPEMRRREKSPVKRGRRNSEKNGGRRSTSKEGRRSKDPCRDNEKPGGCQYGQRCKYSHAKNKPKEVESPERRGRRSPREERNKRRSNSGERGGRRSLSQEKRDNYESQDEGRKRSRTKELCRDIARPGGCTWARCKYFHPEKEQEIKEECNYWLHDTCTYGDKCWGFHEPNRRGIKKRQESRSKQETRQEPRQEVRQNARQEPRNEQRRSSTEGQDFLKSLVSLVSQGITKGSETPLPPSQPLPLPLPFTRRTASPVQGGWRTVQVWEDGSGARAGAGLDRPSFWRQ